MWKWLSGALVALGLLVQPAAAQYFVVASCPSAATIYAAGQTNRVAIVDVFGNVCTSGGVAVTGTLSQSLGLTPTDRTITSASGASQQLMAANTSRHSLTVLNTGNANCGVNPTGGTAVIGGAGTITLFPGGSYTPRVPTLSAVTVICTAGQPIYGDES